MITKFLTGRVKSLVFTIRGAWYLIISEDAAKAQVCLCMLFVMMGFYFGINRYEWMFQFISIGAILATEALNTAVEKICDFIHSDYHSKIGFIKDISAGASTFIVLASLINASIIYYPYLKLYYERII